MHHFPTPYPHPLRETPSSQHPLKAEGSLLHSCRAQGSVVMTYEAERGRLGEHKNIHRAVSLGAFLLKNQLHLTRRQMVTFTVKNIVNTS